MKIKFSLLLLASSLFFSGSAFSKCLTGAFIADNPTEKDILKFEKDYGAKPKLIMVFKDWESLLSESEIKDVYKQDCQLFITLEPWDASSKKGIDYKDLLKGRYNSYLSQLAHQIQTIKEPVWLRFGHEMNGDWYPWNTNKIGKGAYASMAVYIKDFFTRYGVKNIKWVHSINWENVPANNKGVLESYPGDSYADYIGIDGYNWGTTQSWSKWKSFDELFGPAIREIKQKLNKPILITEFGTTGRKGNKAKWIKDALKSIQKEKQIKGFVLFNVDKETDWHFPAAKASGKELKKQLKNRYFKNAKTKK